MKVRKYMPRDRSVSGRATGRLVCRLSVPSKGEDYDLRPVTQNPEVAIEKMRKFVLHHLPESCELLKEANFVISAEVRASSGALDRKRLAVWKYGSDLDSVFVDAKAAWESLELEEDYVLVEADIETPR